MPQIFKKAGLKAPFPWFGGKSQTAPLVWDLLGDVGHYVEPFAGSLAVLLGRPGPPTRPLHHETVNDADGLLVNFWRAVIANPDGLAESASWPVTEADLHARHLALVRWRESEPLERLMADPDWYDLKMAGWWVWGRCCWLGKHWCSLGPWTEEDGKFVKLDSPGVGVYKSRPHLSDGGIGVNHPALRRVEPLTSSALVSWLRDLQTRLRYVRVLNGDWQRVMTPSVLQTMSARMKKRELASKDKDFTGVFLDPPYSGDIRSGDLYSEEDYVVAGAVREWCVKNGSHPSFRIVLAGFQGEGHEVLVEHGWRELDWFSSGYLRGGMGNLAKSGHQQGKERIWASPHCRSLGPEQLEIPDEIWD